MKAVITGDIIGSTKVQPAAWIPVLKQALKDLDKRIRSAELFRGDSFQLLSDPEEAFLLAAAIKASVRTAQSVDVRLAIGIGEADEDDQIRIATGSAFIRSGKLLEQLKPNKINLAIRSGSEKLDETLNLMFGLMSLTMDKWTEVEAALVRLAMLNPDANQHELAKELSKKQSTVSTTLKRAAFTQLMDLDAYYRKHIHTAAGT